MGTGVAKSEKKNAGETFNFPMSVCLIVPTIPSMKYRKTNAKCQTCNLQEKEDQAHVARCEGYQDIREGADLGNETELVKYFSRVMKRRKENGWD